MPTRLMHLALAATTLVAVAALVTMVVFVFSTNRTFDTINQQKAEARVALCLAFNADLAANVNQLNAETQHLVDDTFRGVESGKDAAGKAAIERFIAERDAKFEAVKIKNRDCTPAGIRLFYARKA